MTSLRIALLAAIALACARAAPAPEPAPAPSDDDRPEIIEIIAPAASAQETLASLNLGEPGSELSERNKRTIGILRQLFPTLTQIVEQKIQNFTGVIFRTFGPLFLGALGGSGGTGSSGSGTVTFDDDDDSDVETIPVSSAPASPNEPLKESEPPTAAETSSNSPSEVNPEEEETSKDDTPPETPKSNISSEAPKEDSSSETPADSASETAKDKTLFSLKEDSPGDALTEESSSEAPKADTSSEKPEEDFSPEAPKLGVENETEATPKTIRKRSVAQGSSADENQLLSGAESQQQEVRVQFADGAGKDLETAASEDQETAAQTNSQIDEISLEDTDQTEQDRNKRQGFLGFNAGGSTGSSGGSGNFLFDIIRLVAGSSATEPAEDGGDGADADGTAAKGDNLTTEGVPGPITRLFIIANRGIANLIQDLILRLAQTSERIVNFKARLITSII